MVQRQDERARARDAARGRPDGDVLQRWLGEVARGDRQALAILYGQTSPQLFALLLRTLKRRDLAEEVLHDVYLKVWERAAAYDPARGPVMAWLVAIARHAALDRLRRGRREVPFDANPEVLDVPDANPDPSAAMFATAEVTALRRCLDALEPEPRDCLVLAYWEGLTHDELARRLERPVGTVKSWIRRSLLRLRQCLEGA